MNTFGRIFKVSIFGESHGDAVGITVDGTPAGIPISEQDMIPLLERRKSGRTGTTPRREPDRPRIVTGVFNGHATGAPMTILFENTNTRSKDYGHLVETPRPGHADYSGARKFRGFQDFRGGGHFSGRITLGLVAASAVARKIIAPATVRADILEVGGETDIEAAVERAVAAEDSLGGLIECRVTGLPQGLGEPFFDSVESLISHAIFAVPATRGIEFGTGFAAARMRGSEHNDCFTGPDGETATNHAGGINGGITNGNEVVFRVAIKPTSSIGVTQRTFSFGKREMVDLAIGGRHDSCITLRIPPVIEAVTAIVMADLLLVARAANPGPEALPPPGV